MMYPHPPYMWTDPHHTHNHPSHMPPYQQTWSYPVPQLPLGCCNHPYYYYYYGASPYTFHPHYPPPPPSFFPHGLYSPYSVPPQHYSVEHPRYEYDKNNHHSCACNHHDKIPEKSQADNNTSDSMAPLLSKDRHDYPIMWLPPGYTESKANDKENYSNEPVSVNHTQPSKQVESQVNNKTSDSLVPLLLKDRPDYPIVWVPRSYVESKANDKDKYSHEPVSLKPPEPLKQGRNGEVDQDEQDKRFPFKIFWLPSNNDQVGKETKENNLDLVANNEGSRSARTMKNNYERSGSDGQRETSSKHAAQATANEEAGNKDAVQKVIPVKEASTNEEKKNLKSIDTNSDSVGKMDNGSRASPKASKLPPVCLRIDPLPKKKKSSRSPSPGEKGRSNESPVNSPKPSQQQAQVLKVEQANLADHANKVEHANLVNHGDMPKEKGDESKKSKVKEKKNISEHDAALIIQSVYRGFEVRKSQPLKKLKQINEVRKQVSDLRNRIQDLETSSSTTSFDGKKSVIIGETIMSLLLKLDTIQGLHPFVREVRKSVAKELVGLQEKLDSLVKSITLSEGTNCSPLPVMHPEDDGKLDQGQAQTGLCENHEHKYDAEACNTHNVEQQLEKTEEEKFDQAQTKSDTVICENHEHKDDSEACNTPSVEQQLEKNAEQDEFGQATSEYYAIICENHEVEATVPQEGCNTIGEPQLESHEEKFHQTLNECDEVKATESQEGCNTIGERQLESHKEKIDQAPAECDEGGNTIGEPQLGSNKALFDQAPTECDGAVGLCENNEVRTATELQEGCNTVEEPSHEEKLDHAETECNEALEFHKEHHEVEATETQEGCNVIGEPQLDSHEENLDQAPTECDEALGLHKENHEVEATESKEGCDTSDELQLESHKDQATVECEEALGLCEENHESHEDCHMVDESHKEKCDQVASECDVEANDNDDDDDMTLEDNTGEVNNKQPESEDLANAERLMQTDMVSEKANEGDGRLMQENEKLRAAVEELMKAGNDQLGVIRELTGRVKDLEKKLSKKKKKKVKVNKGRRVRDCVV